MPRGEGADLVLEEHEARRVLQHLRARVGAEAGLGDPGRDVRRLVGRDAGRQQQLPRALRLARVEGAAPGEVAGAALGESRPRDQPALQVLGARGEAQGRRVLNLFCYTGSFSVYAAAGGASETVSVDLSNTYLDWTRTNLSRNDFKDAGRHRLVRDEARAFLEHRARRGEPAFDLVVCDPPTYSRSARSETPWDVQRDHAELLELVAKNLAPGGVVYFSSNFRRFHLDTERLAAAYAIREITNRTIPEDFRNDRIHRAWRLVAGS